MDPETMRSPCTLTCRLTEAGLWAGCGRRRGENRRWRGMTAVERDRYMEAVLPERMAALPKEAA